ncbi:MAG: Low molecular weight protein-tyrosine-phosphatase YwlE [candidate division BRC1 bacterium ADurb.BinA292]|nr:MAG: Low molecular weight protein-tyrosine-phosphatase YwlE [candidate division BRC1 bacterium ADurb.BinA292]
MAAGYFRRLLEERKIKDIEVRSAGVMTITGLLASQEAIQVMDGVSVDLRRHRSTQLTSELIRKADLILAMTPFHRQTAVRMDENAKDKTYLLKEFTRSDLKNVQIADPMGCTLEVFKKCFKEIRSACDKLIEHEFVTGRPAPPPPRKAEAARKAAARAKSAAGAGRSAKSASRKSASKATATKKTAGTKPAAARGKAATAGQAAAKRPKTPAAKPAPAKTAPAKRTKAAGVASSASTRRNK